MKPIESVDHFSLGQSSGNPTWLVALALWGAGSLLEAATVTWVGGSGDWSVATNWSTGALPGPGDEVTISVNAGPPITITHSSGTDTVQSVLTDQAFVLSGGSLSAVSFAADNVFTLAGGTLLQTGLRALSHGSFVVASGTMDGVTLISVLDVGSTVNGATLTVRNGFTLGGGTVLVGGTNGNSGVINFSGNLALEGNGSVVFGSHPSNNALRLTGSGTTLVIESGVTVHGQNGAIGFSSAWGGPSDVTLINQGTISADVAGGTLAPTAQFFANEGLAQAINGGTLVLSSTCTNSGTLSANGGRLSLSGVVSLGPSSVLSGTSNGTVSLTGTIANTNATVSFGGAGSWVLNSGTVKGGAITTTNGAALAVNGGGTLDGVTVNGLLDVGNSYSGAKLSVTNGLGLNGTARVGNPTNSWWGHISFEGSQTLSGNGTVIFGSQVLPGYNALWLTAGGTTLTLAPGITVRGQNGTIGYNGPFGGPPNVSVINQGTVTADVPGGTIVLDGQPFSNQGAMGAASGGTLLLAGYCINSGSFPGSGGTVTIAGSFDNQGEARTFSEPTTISGNLTNGAGGTLTFNGPATITGFLNNQGGQVVVNGANQLNLNGGTVLGGTVIATNGESLAVNGGGTLDGVTVNGLLDVGNSYSGAKLSVTNGLGLNGTARVGNPTNSWWGYISFEGSQTLSGNGTVIFGSQVLPGYNALWLTAGGTTLTLARGITVRGQNGTIGYNGPFGGPPNVSVINQGTVTADVPGGTIVLDGQPFSNQGAMGAASGGTLVVAETWVDSGISGGASGPVTISGNFGDQGGTLTFNAPGTITGFLNNQGGQVVVNGANQLNLNGGTVLGGTLIATNGASVVIGNGDETLDGVTVNGLLDVGNSYSGVKLSVTNGLGLNGTARVGNPTNGWWGYISFAGSQTLSGNGTVIFGSQVLQGYNALWLRAGGTTLTVAPGITVRGQNGTIGYNGPFGGPQNVSVINQGTVTADVPGGTIVLDGQPFSNQGAMGAASGGTLLLAGACINSGSFVGSSGTVTIAGSFDNQGGARTFSEPTTISGNLTNGAGGSLTFNGGTITGFVNNQGGQVVVNGASQLGLNGGTVLGGTVIATNGASLALNGSGTLDGATVNGLLDVGNSYSGAKLSVTNGLGLNGTARVGNPTNSWWGYINFEGSQTLSGNGTVIFGNQVLQGYNALWLAAGGTTLTLGPGITVRGQNGTIGYNGPFGGPQNVSVINQGTISADPSGGVLVIAGGAFTNAGRLVQPEPGGLLNLDAGVVNTGLIEVDQSALTFGGGLTQSVGTLSFGLNSLGDFGQMDLIGPSSVGGTLAAHLGTGFLPSAGDSFALLSYGTNRVAFTNTALPTSAVWQTGYAQGEMTLLVVGVRPFGVTISPSNQTVATGSVATLAAVVSGPGPFAYQWQWDGATLAGATNASLVLSNVSSSADGSYAVLVGNTNGQVLSAAAVLSVLAPPAIQAGPQPQTASVGTVVTFQVNATGAPPLSYQWTFDGQVLVAATNSSLILNNVTRAQAGTYGVLLTNAVGSAQSAAVLSIATGVSCPGVPAGMVAWWRGEDNTSDYAGTNDAIFEGAAAYRPGEVGQAFVFDGSSSYLQVPDSPLWSPGANDFAFEFWAWLARLGPSVPAGDGSVAFIAHDEGPGFTKWLFGYGGQELYWYQYDPVNGPSYVAPAAVNLVTNQWYHLAVTKQGRVFQIYLDGRVVGAETNDLTVPAASAPLTIGQAQGLFLKGSMDEISVYTRALQSSEVQGIYQAGAQGKCGLESGGGIRLQAQLASDGKLVLLIGGGQTGATLGVQATSDFQHWTEIGHLLKGADPTVFTDLTANPPRWRYYRVVVEY